MLLDSAMYDPYVRLLRSRGRLCALSPAFAVSSPSTILFLNCFSDLVAKVPRKLANMPTTKSLDPFLTTAVPRCTRVHLCPNVATWKALSGHVDRNVLKAATRRELRNFPALLAAPRRSVGAGSHTRQKSAMIAIATSAATKSSSFQKAPLRFSHSASDFVPTPIPHSMPILVMNMGSAIMRSRNPAKPTKNFDTKVLSRAANNATAVTGTRPAFSAEARFGGKLSSVLPAMASALANS
mmetsp:Transcript_8940/g.15318  ORF Transcript_8940/g.15318 Transcript_8940/m.15318 type:complete len:239 (+) Transcript_8940:688-1404(+)